MKEKTYDCPQCGRTMEVLGWTPEMKTIGCSSCGQEMAARNHKAEIGLLEFLER